MKKGIILLAIGNEVYGKFAYNLAICLKYYSPDIPITLVYDSSAVAKLENRHFAFFDSMLAISKEDTLIDGKFSPAKAKLSIYKYSPYEQTIFLDVDTVIHTDITPLFDTDKPFYIQTLDKYCKEGEKAMPNMLWGYRDKVWEHFDLGENYILPAVNSSFFYFDSRYEGTKFFTLASILLVSMPYPNTPEYTPYTWGKGAYQPDELYFNIALAKLGYDGKELGYNKPLYFRPRPQTGNELGIEAQREQGYYGLGCYGKDNNNHMSIYRQYDSVVRQVSYDLLKQNQEFKIHRMMDGKLANHK